MKHSATKQGKVRQTSSKAVMTCFEHQWLTQADFHHPHDFDYLVAQEFACFDIKVKQGQVCLVVSHYLANIVLPSGQVLEILPKVSQVISKGAGNLIAEIESVRAWVAIMLAEIGLEVLSKPLEAMSLQSKAPNVYNFHNATPFYDINGLPYSESLTKLSSSSTNVKAPWYEGVLLIAQQKLIQATVGLPRCYQTQTHNQPQAQGKINLSAQLKQNWHRPHYLYTEQSQFVTDTDLVAFLATGWTQVQRLTQGKMCATPEKLQGVKPLPVSQWHKVYQQFCQESKRQASWLAQLAPRQVAGLIEGIQWCWWLLTQGGLELKQDKKDLQKKYNVFNQQQAIQSLQDFLPSPAIMINMNHAFERWVLVKLISWVGEQLPNSQLVIQHSLDWLVSVRHNNNHAQNLQQPQVIQRLIPDACICDAQGQITHVIDIKYKAIHKPQQISSRDWQQLAVYQQYLQCQNGWLIYPKTENFTQRLDVTQNIDDNTQHSQHDSLYVSQMSAIAFDFEKAKLLI